MASPEGETLMKAERALKIEGRVNLDAMKGIPRDLKLMAYAIDGDGELLGCGGVDTRGRYCVRLKSAAPRDVEIVFGAENWPLAVLKGSIYRVKFSAADWPKDTRSARR